MSGHQPLLGSGALLGDGITLYRRQCAAMEDAYAAAGCTDRLNVGPSREPIRRAIAAYLRSMYEQETARPQPSVTDATLSLGDRPPAAIERTDAEGAPSDER